MPIKPENRARYPKDWPARSLAARERAKWQCEHQGCAARQYAVGKWLRLTANAATWTFIEWSQGVSYKDALRQAAELFHQQSEEGVRPVVIVLTVAHLNHTPEDCRPENLAAMCQRHHLAYDADHHKRTAYATRKAAAHTADLF